MVVRGNHDHAVAFEEDPRCSARFRKMADETGRFTRSVLSSQDVRYLRGLPLKAGCEMDGRRVLLCHAAPSDPLYDYRPPESDRWTDVVNEAGSDIFLVGHTHLPFRRIVDGKTILNPGSVGQPKHGRPEASYAIWEDGSLRIESVPYDFERTIHKLSKLALSPDVFEDLEYVLRSGRVPEAR
jgi:protein phosphatase